MAKCIVCDGHEFTVIHHGTRDIHDMDVLKCNNCGMVRLASFDHIKDYYENSEMRQNKIINSMAIDERIKNDVRRSSFFLPDYIGKDILDFGCGLGGFLKNARNYANSVAGVEKDEELIRTLQDSQIDIRSDICEFDRNFDFISLFHVIEHLIDPYDYLYKIRNKLNKDGLLVVETPNADDALLSLYNSEEFKSFSYWGCHVQLYTSKTLETVLKKSGYEIVWSRQIQRYPLSNHLYWLKNGKPGGHKVWGEIGSDILEKEYEKILGQMGKCDTLLIKAKRSERTI